MSDSQKNVSLDAGGLFIVAIIVLVFLYVWPGPCKYDYRTAKNGELIRINRISGEPSAFYDGKYNKITNINKDIIDSERSKSKK